MDRDLGLIHVRVQTWFPLQIQVYLNGHEWLARKLAAREIRCTKLDNVFAWIEDLPQAQRLANRFSQLDWPRILNRYATHVVPQLGDVLYGCEYYWVAAALAMRFSRASVSAIQRARWWSIAAMTLRARIAGTLSTTEAYASQQSARMASVSQSIQVSACMPRCLSPTAGRVGGTTARCGHRAGSGSGRR